MGDFMKRSRIISLSAAILLGVFVFGGRAARADIAPTHTLSTGINAVGIADDGSSFWIFSDNNVTNGQFLKVRKSDLGVISSIPNPYDKTSTYPLDVLFDGTSIWVNYTNTQLIKINPTTATITNQFTTLGCGSGHMTHDGAGTLLILSGPNNFSPYICRVRTSDGTRLATLPLPSRPTEIEHIGSNYYISDAQGIKRVDPTTGAVLAQNTTLGAPKPATTIRSGRAGGLLTMALGDINLFRLDQTTLVLRSSTTSIWNMGTITGNLSDRILTFGRKSVDYQDLFMVGTMADPPDALNQAGNYQTLTGSHPGGESVVYPFDVIVQSGIGYVLEQDLFMRFDLNNYLAQPLPAPPPITISSLRVSNIGATSAQIDWDTDVVTGTNVVMNGLTPTPATTDGTGKKHTAFLTNLAPVTPYTFSAVSQQAGYTDGSAPISFTTIVPPPLTITVGPTWTQLSPTSVRIDWTTLQDSDSEVDYGVDQTYSLTPVTNTALTKSHQITLTSLTPGQLYNFRVKSHALNFTDAVSANQRFTTTLPTITISNARVSYVGAFSVNVSWQTSVSTSTNFTTLGFTTTQASAGFTHDLLVPLRGLESSKDYTITVSSGETGYATARTDVPFTTLAPFTVSSAPTGTQNVTQGSLATFTITVVQASDLSFASLALATNPALANSTQTFSPPDITPSQRSSTLTFTTEALSIGPIYSVPVTVTCDSCDPVYTATVMPSFKVGAVAPACELSLTPPSTNVMSGTTGTLQLQLTPLNGFASTMNLSNISLNPAYPASKLSWNSFIGGSASLQQGVSIDTSNVAPGSYQVKFRAKDPVGTVACDSQAVMVTVGPPDFTITAVPTTKTVSKNQFADYEFQVRPIGTFTGSVQVSILTPNAGKAWPLGTYSPTAGAFGNALGSMSVRVDTTTIPEGIYWAKVRAVSGSITHEIDPVELIVGPPGTCNDPDHTADQTCSATLQWCDLSVSPSVSNNCVTNGQKCPPFQCAAPQTCNTTTGTCVGDTTPPVISLPQCLTTMNSATITWTTDEPANSEVLWRKSTEPLPYLNVLSTDPLPTGATSHVVPIPQNGQLSPSTLYYVKVKSTNRLGYTAESAEIQCTTLATADTQAPVVQITFPASGSTIVSSTAVRADASDNNGVVRVEFNTTNPSSVTASINVDTISPYEVNWSVAGLPSGTYALTAKATDAAGNIGVSPQVNVVVNNDTRKPVISNFLPRRTAPSQYTVTWTTNEQATSWVYYCLEPASGGACTYTERAPVNGTAPSMSHRIVIDGLLLNRNYHLTPISCDSAGNCNNTKPF